MTVHVHQLRGCAPAPLAHYLKALAILRLVSEQRDPAAIERTNITSLLLARDEAALASKSQRLGAAASFRGFSGTVAQAIDLVGQYRDAGVQLLISSAFRNDAETFELVASDIMPHFG